MRDKIKEGGKSKRGYPKAEKILFNDVLHGPCTKYEDLLTPELKLEYLKLCEDQSMFKESIIPLSS